MTTSLEIRRVTVGRIVHYNIIHIILLQLVCFLAAFLMILIPYIKDRCCIWLSAAYLLAVFDA